MSKKWYVYKSSAEIELREGNLPAAERLWLAALEEAEEFSTTDVRLLVTLESLSEIYFEQDQFLQSAAVARRLLQIYMTSSLASKSDIGTMAQNVALIYRGWQRFDKAIQFYETALDNFSTVFDQSNSVIVGLKNDLEATREQLSRGPTVPQEKRGRMSRTGSWDAVPTPSSDRLTGMN